MPLWAGAMRTATQPAIPFRMLSKDDRFKEDGVTPPEMVIGAAGLARPLNLFQRLLLALCTCNSDVLTR
eukprot:scaffold214072_cov36-Tisochrysis_lutea.AAC.6